MLDLEEQRVPDLEDLHELWTSNDALILDGSDPNPKGLSTQTAICLVQKVSAEMSRKNLQETQRQLQRCGPKLREQRTPDSRDHHQSRTMKAAPIAAISGPSLVNPEDRTSCGAASTGVQGEEQRRKQSEAALLAIRLAQDRAKFFETGPDIPPSSEMLVFNGGRQLFITSGGLLGLGPETHLSRNDQQSLSQSEETYNDKTRLRGPWARSYERFRQQAGTPVGSIAGLETANDQEKQDLCSDNEQSDEAFDPVMQYNLETKHEPQWAEHDPAPSYPAALGQDEAVDASNARISTLLAVDEIMTTAEGQSEAEHGINFVDRPRSEADMQGYLDNASFFARHRLREPDPRFDLCRENLVDWFREPNSGLFQCLKARLEAHQIHVQLVGLPDEGSQTFNHAHWADRFISGTINTSQPSRPEQAPTWVPRWDLGSEVAQLVAEDVGPGLDLHYAAMANLPWEAISSDVMEARIPRSCRPHQLCENEDYEYGSESSYAASVFSIATMVSSVSNLSVHNNYSSQQIATATRELFDIFLKDGDLIQLYRRAVDDDEIGPERLQRNLRRLLRAYAKNLENEHTESLEYLASRLVAMKSVPLARAIIEKYHSALVEEEAETCTVQDDSSGDEAASQPVDETIFEDLKAFREFLTGAAAFETFKAQIRSFVIPKSQPVGLLKSTTSGEKSTHGSTHMAAKATAKTHTWQAWRTELAEAVDLLLTNRDFGLATRVASHVVFDAFTLATDHVFIAIGFLEPPLSSKMVRLRWRCVSVCIRTTFKPSTNKRLGM
jgi:hypothetical protein